MQKAKGGGSISQETIHCDHYKNNRLFPSWTFSSSSTLVHHRPAVGLYTVLVRPCPLLSSSVYSLPSGSLISSRPTVGLYTVPSWVARASAFRFLIFWSFVSLTSWENRPRRFVKVRRLPLRLLRSLQVAVVAKFASLPRSHLRSPGVAASSLPAARQQPASSVSPSRGERSGRGSISRASSESSARLLIVQTISPEGRINYLPHSQYLLPSICKHHIKSLSTYFISSFHYNSDCHNL